MKNVAPAVALITLFAAAGTGLWLEFRSHQAPKYNREPKINQRITNDNQQSGLTVRTINIGQGHADFNDQIKAEILQKIPTGEVLLQTAGGAAEQKIGTQVQEFLVRNGYDVERMKIGVISPPPDQAFSARIMDNRTIFVVAPSAK